MFGSKPEVFIVLPKYSSFELKDISQQTFYKSEAFKWLEFFRELDMQVKCFAEDMLAVKLFYAEPDIIWVSTLGAADSRFMELNVTDYPAEYRTIQKVSAPEMLIKKAVRRLKVKDLEYYFGDEVAFRNNRFNVLLNRIRFVADAELAEKNVVYFDANNNFCSEPDGEIGDGRFVVSVSVDKCITKYTYGGMMLTEEHFDQIMRGVYGR